MPRRHAIVLLCLSLLCAAHAGEDTSRLEFHWKKAAGVEYAERVFPSAVDPNTVFVWTRGGLLASKDNGLSFAARGQNTAAQLGSLTALLVSPLTPATLYAGTLEKGVFLSDDEGNTWRRLSGVDKGLASPRIHALLFSPNDATFTTLFATHSPQQPGISMTVDGGMTWRAFAQNYGAGDLILAGTTMFFAGSRPAGGAGTGFYRSIDAGTNWYRILNVESPTVLVASKVSHRRAWCGTASGLFVTDDFGVSTRRVGPQSEMNVASIAAGFGEAGGEPVFVYEPTTEGLLLSTDEFKTWHKLNDGLYVGDWVAEGAMMAAAGSTLFACINGSLYRGAARGSGSALSSIRVEPAAAVAGADAVTFTCRAAPGAEVSIDLSPIGGAAAVPLRDDGQSGDGRMSDGVYGVRLEKVPVEILAKAHERDYRGPVLPGLVALNVRARAGGVTESGLAFLTVLQPTANVVLWDGEDHNNLVVRTEGGVGLSRCQEHPFTGGAHLRLAVSGPGLAGFGWKQSGQWGGGDDTRFHKLLSFCIRSDTPGPSDLRLSLRDDGLNYGRHNAQSSNQVALSQYLPALTTSYQRIAIPMAHLILGGQATPDHIQEIVFTAPGPLKTRSYDIDDVVLAAKPGPLLSGCDAVLSADGATVRITTHATSAGGRPQSVKACCGDKEFPLQMDAAGGDACYAATVPVAQLGSGARTFRFVAGDAAGTSEQSAVIFVPRRAPGRIVRAKAGVKLDGDLSEFAGATPFVIGDDALSLRARVLYDKQSLYVTVAVKDAAFNPQPPKKGEHKKPPEKLAETCGVTLCITSPTAATHTARTAAAEEDFRFNFVMDEKDTFALRGRDRLSAVGKRTDGGYTITAQIPFDRLRTRRAPCDFDRGKTTRIEWRLLGADGKALTWAAPNAEASANPDTWGLAIFADETAAP